MPPLDFEKIKTEGLQVDFLKYTQEGFEAIKPEDHYRLKTYGVCAQRHEGYFMIRIRIPGGIIRAEQMEKIADLAERFGHGWGHLTTRGNIELHSVKINDFISLIEELAGVGITTRSACGHTFRNILGCPQTGVCLDEVFDTYPWIQEIHNHIFKKAEFYNRRLPRRLNVSFSGCANCSADAHINDIGFIAKEIEEEGETRYGFELWVAGSLGSAPRLAHKLREFVSFDEVIPSLEAITELYCLHGERRNPAKARLKFLVESWGIEKFKEEFERKLAEFKATTEPLPEELTQPVIARSPKGATKQSDARRHPERSEGSGDPSAALRPQDDKQRARNDEVDGRHNGHPNLEGVFPQRQEGFYRVVVWVPLGELKAAQMKRIAELSRQLGDGRLYNTTRQNFEFHHVKKESVETLIQELGLIDLGTLHSNSLLDVVACPGTSFCSLAVTSSQGAARVLMKEFYSRHYEEEPGLQRLKINISGCPNSCAKHQIADIGFSGGLTEIGGIRRYGYQLYVGGRFEGEKVAGGAMIKKGIPDDMVFPIADTLLEIYREGRTSPEEEFSDFVERLGQEPLVKILDEKLSSKCPLPPESPIPMIPVEILGGQDSNGLVKVGSVQEFETAPAKIVTLTGEEVAVFKTTSGFFACQNTCPHAGGSLGEGKVEGTVVTCPLHEWQFELKTGRSLTNPGNDLRIFPLEVKEKEVFLKRP